MVTVSLFIIDSTLTVWHRETIRVTLHCPWACARSTIKQYLDNMIDPFVRVNN